MTAVPGELPSSSSGGLLWAYWPVAPLEYSTVTDPSRTPCGCLSSAQWGAPWGASLTQPLKGKVLWLLISPWAPKAKCFLWQHPSYQTQI